MIRVTITHRNDNPDTIWNALARRLGREPTDAEATAEVRRILAGDEVQTCEKARHAEAQRANSDDLGR